MARFSGAYKGTPTLAEPEWFRKAAAKMVREGKNLLLVVDELGIPGLTSKEIEDIHRSNTFQAVLRNERLRYATEVARDPALTKDAAIGMMLISIERLMAEGQSEKVVLTLEKLAKLTGWIGADNAVNVFADLKQRDYDELKRRIAGKNNLSTEKLN